LKAKHKIVAWLALAFLLVTLAVTVTFWTFRQIEEAAAVRKHTNTILDGAEKLLFALKDAETSERGYLLTGQEEFLEPYSAVRESISSQLKELRRITLVSAAQQHLDTLAPLVDAKLADMSYTIELRRNHDVTKALAVIGSSQGMRLMDSIRDEMDSFILLEQGVLAQREAEFQSSMRHMFILIVASSLFTIVFAFAFAYLVYRETQQSLKNLVHLETRHLLEVQEEMNKQLQLANNTLQESEEKLAVTLNSIGDAVDRHRCPRACDTPESPRRKAHRLDAGGSDRSPGGRDLSHHQPGNPSTCHRPDNENPGAWHDTWSGQPHHHDCTGW